MVQQYLPLFKEGVQLINNYVGYEKRDGNVYYYVGQAILFFHRENDLKTFRCMTSQLIETGNVRQSEIIRAFGVSKKSVLRSVAKYREGGIKAFYEERKVKGGTVITPEVKEKIEELLQGGQSVKEIAKTMEIKQDTIEKAIRQKRIKKKVKN